MLLLLGGCRWGFGLLGDDTVTIDPDADIVVDDGGKPVTCSTDHDCGNCQRCESNVCQRADFVELGLGQANACAFDERGELWCWGWNQYLAVDEDVPVDEVVPRPRRTGITEVDRLDVGWAIVMLRKTDQSLATFGGLSANVNDTQAGWDQISAGIFAACALNTNTTVSCAGMNDNAQLGRGMQDPDGPESFGPFDGGSSGWKQVSTANLTCAITLGGRLFCTGTNNNGELGRGTQSPYETDVGQVGTDADWAEVHVGDQHVCALKTNGTLWCWGLDVPTAVAQTTPKQVGTATDWSHLASDFRASCALRGGTDLWCVSAEAHWMFALIGDLISPWARMPIDIDPGTRPVLGGHTACIRQNGDWVCWGDDARGQVGRGTLAMVAAPARLCE